MGEIREELVAPPADGEVLVRARHGALSRGTESLVFQGLVPESEWRRMRCPFQGGEFPGPVKYGYISVGTVEQGDSDLLGKTVFCLYPHQALYTVPRVAVSVVPDDVPAARAVLAANMETALNIVWDAGISPGDRVSVIGGGVVGCLTAHLAREVPGTEVQIVDIDRSKAPLFDALQLDSSMPETARPERDILIHTSATEVGLNRCLELAGAEAMVVEASWYGDRPVNVRLGGAFHSKRLSLIASQVGMVAKSKRGRVSYKDRMRLALGLLADERLDALFTHEVPFGDLPEEMPDLMASAAGIGCVRIRYPDAAQP